MSYLPGFPPTIKTLTRGLQPAEQEPHDAQNYYSDKAARAPSGLPGFIVWHGGKPGQRIGPAGNLHSRLPSKGHRSQWVSGRVLVASATSRRVYSILAHVCITATYRHWSIAAGATLG